MSKALDLRVHPISATRGAAVLECRDPQINIDVHDVERMTRFYTEHLGFKETFRVPTTGTPEHVEAPLGGCCSASRALPRRSRITASMRIGKRHAPSWCSGSTTATRRTPFCSRRGRPVSEPHDFIGVLRGAWIDDPEGNPIHVVSK